MYTQVISYFIAINGLSLMEISMAAMCDQVVRIKDGSVVSSVGNAHKLSASEIEL